MGLFGNSSKAEYVVVPSKARQVIRVKGFLQSCQAQSKGKFNLHHKFNYSQIVYLFPIHEPCYISSWKTRPHRAGSLERVGGRQRLLLESHFGILIGQFNNLHARRANICVEEWRILGDFTLELARQVPGNAAQCHRGCIRLLELITKGIAKRKKNM